MCGIAGFSGKNDKLAELISKSILHRGPDFSGVFCNENITLIHNLLAIRAVEDISKQPYKDNPEWVLVFNGQIYNTEKLKKNLQNLDKNKESLDTYVLYKIIEKYGWEFYKYTHGMYAIALYNRKQNILKLYRDQAGQKNIYWSFNGKKIVFASEIKAILEDSDINRDVDEDAIMISSKIGSLPGDKTIFKAIKKVRPGEIITFDIKNLKVSKEFFKCDTAGFYSGNLESVFKNLLEEHIQSKDRIAINLSGGIDSSILLHEIRNYGHEVDSYTTSFQLDKNISKNYNDDALLAKRLSDHYKTKHTEILITKKDYLNNFFDAYSAIEEPNYNISLPVYLITAKHEGINGDKKRVVLKGDGGDELFGGYPHYLEVVKLQKKMKMFTPPIFNLLKNFRNHTNLNFNRAIERWFFYRKFKNGFANSRDSEILKYLNDSSEYYLKFYNQKDKEPLPMMMLDRVLWMAGEFFIASDKLYMNQSMEVRSPLSYQPFRDYFDASLSNSDYINESSNKIALRRYAEHRLPDFITKRKEKTGWRAPIEAWYDKECKEKFLEIISGLDSKNGLIDWDGLRKKIESSEKWPGKTTHIYLSLASLAKKFKLNI